ncbi:MAG: protein phosphatase 2C domain-containing protein [Myxococcota bacterium]
MRALHSILTDVGNVRERNEDHAGGDPERGLFLLADGMGGHPAGHLASQVAIQTAMAFLTEKRVPGRARGRGEKLGQAILAANHQILQLGVEHQEVQGMGTTLVGMWLGKSKAHFAHVGDSRAYLYREEEAHILTRDHTVLRELVDRGELSPDAPEAAQIGHILTQAVGLEEDIAPDIVTLETQKNDVFLLCSDGLSDLLKPPRIAAILNGVDKNNLDDRAQKLVQAALEAGGHDNITVVLARTA